MKFTQCIPISVRNINHNNIDSFQMRPGNSSSVSWNALLEAQFMLDLACDPDTGLEIYLPPDLDDPKQGLELPDNVLYKKSILPSVQSVSTPTWSLKVLDEGTSGTVGRHTAFRERIRRKDMRNKRKMSRKWMLRKSFPLRDFYQSSEDWSDLYLVRKMLGGRGMSSESEDEETASEEEFGYNLDKVVDDLLYRESIQVKEEEAIELYKTRRPVQEQIRLKVLAAKSVSVSLSSNVPEDYKIEECLNVLYPIPASDVESQVIGDVENEESEIIVEPEYDASAFLDLEIRELDTYDNETLMTNHDYNLRKRSTPEDKNEEPKKKYQKKEKWYEKQPFEEPVLEAKRLRSLKAKITHDKNRFDLEILKFDHRELKHENLSLKQELQKSKEREAELNDQLIDKEAAEARVKELELEVNLRRQNEDALKSELDQMSGKSGSVILVQVELESATTGAEK